MLYAAFCVTGVHGSRYVTTHGISINCNTDLQWFKHIIPCGLHGKNVTSLTEELGQLVTVKDTIPPFLFAFQEEFDCEMVESLRVKTVLTKTSDTCV